MWGVEAGVIVAMIIVNSVFAAYERSAVPVSVLHHAGSIAGP